MSHRARTAHLASALSVVEILVAAYQVARVSPATAADPGRDRVILSKGHAVSALYCVLARRGFFPEAELDLYNQEGGRLPEQPSPGCVSGLELATGSLGHGLPFGLGVALAGRIQRHDYHVTVVMSDGECQEGSVWEAAMLAPVHALANLCAVVDCNGWQATGRCHEVMALAPLAAKWEAFGWQAVEVDGHDLTALESALRRPREKPTAILARTVKGRGVSFMEDDNNWHYRIPDAGEVARGRRELGLA